MNIKHKNKFLYVLFVITFFNLSSLFAWPSGGIIYNSTTPSERKIALGVNPEAHLNTYNGNIVRNASATGIAYYFPNFHPRGRGYGGGRPGWYDATSPGCLCEGWGVGGYDRFNRQFHGRASVHTGRIYNVTVKNFVVDSTSIESVVWLNDRSGNPALEVKHVFSPSRLATDYLFEAKVTITNISGSTIKDVRYNRSMDWDIHPTEFSERVTIRGAAASSRSPNNPKLLYSGRNGFMTPNPFNSIWNYWAPYNTDLERYGPQDHGFTATFKFGDLKCGESSNFIIYYGAAENRNKLIDAFSTESVPLYSLGEPSHDFYGSVTYGFGFKGVSGTALAPTLPEKIAVLPAGVDTDPSIIQTYAPPVITGEYAYQSIFNFRNDHQWEGDILRYKLMPDGSFSAEGVISAKNKISSYHFTDRHNMAHSTFYDYRSSASRQTSGRGKNIWTVGYDPNCPGTETPFFRRKSVTINTPSGFKEILDLNNFQDGSMDSLPYKFSNMYGLYRLMNNCEPISNPVDFVNLIDFVRGVDVYNEDSISGDRRQSFIGDTFHSNLVYVGAPSATTSYSNEYSESYFRSKNNYEAFKDRWENREERLYVGANDGMLHAFDKELNHLWSFVPPAILPKLRSLEGSAGKTNSQWLVDGPVIVKDVYIHATNEWKTLLIGGLGWGGKGYYVLDITDEWNPKHLFSFENDYKNKQVIYWSETGYKRTYDYADAPDNINYSNIGDTWAKPSIILLPYEDQTDPTFKQRYVMVFGGGYSGGLTTNLGNYIYVLDFEPSNTTYADPVYGINYRTYSGGNVIKKIEVSKDIASDIPPGITADMTVVGADNISIPESKDALTYFGGMAYFLDLQGQFWKLDLSKTSLTENNNTMFSLNKMFRTEGTVANDRYGYNQVASTLVESTAPIDTNLFHYFGTGDQAHIQRRDGTILNRIYGIKDFDWPATSLDKTGSDKIASSAGILNVDAVNCDEANVPGWFFNIRSKSNLDNAYGDFIKNIGRPVIANKDIYFSNYRPEDKECPVYGESEIIVMKNSCGGGSTAFSAGSGLITSPVISKTGNIYIGVSNIKKGSSLDGLGERGLEGSSSVGNLLRIGSSDIEVSSSDPELNIKSWREIEGDDGYYPGGGGYTSPGDPYSPGGYYPGSIY